jgi:hypothetical protein
MFRLDKDDACIDTSDEILHLFLYHIYAEVFPWPVMVAGFNLTAFIDDTVACF